MAKKHETVGAPRGKSRSLGRRLAIGITVAALGYLCLSGLVSVVPMLFWPERPALDPSVTCDAGLAELRTELFEHAGEHVRAGHSVAGDADDTLTPFLNDWDRRHLALEERCSGDDRWSLLARVRQRLEGTLERFDDNEAELDLDIERLTRGT